MGKVGELFFFTRGLMGTVEVFLGGFLKIFCFFTFFFLNYRSDRKTSRLLTEMDQQKEEILNSESELKDKMKQIEINQAEEKRPQWHRMGLQYPRDNSCQRQDAGRYSQKEKQQETAVHMLPCSPYFAAQNKL